MPRKQHNCIVLPGPKLLINPIHAVLSAFWTLPCCLKIAGQISKNYEIDLVLKTPCLLAKSGCLVWIFFKAHLCQVFEVFFGEDGKKEKITFFNDTGHHMQSPGSKTWGLKGEAWKGLLVLPLSLFTHVSSLFSCCYSLLFRFAFIMLFPQFSTKGPWSILKRTQQLS